MNYAGKAKRQGLVEELYARNTDEGASKEEMYYLSVLRACRQDRNVARAMGLTAEMSAKGLMDHQAWLTLLDVCAVSGDIAATKQVFEDLRAEGHADEVAYNRLIKGYCAADDVKSAKQKLARSADRHGAWEALEALRADGLSEDWYTVLAL